MVGRLLLFGCRERSRERPIISIASCRVCFFHIGHPSFNHVGELVSKALGVTNDKGIRNASVVLVGQGNVALDCARVLTKASPGLYDTDLAARALPVLGDGVAKVSIVGRRGHIQGAFTIKEVRELVNLEDEGHDTCFVVRTDELDMGATSASQSELMGPQGRPKTRIDSLLRKAAAKGTSPLAMHIDSMLLQLRHNGPCYVVPVIGRCGRRRRVTGLRCGSCLESSSTSC